MCVLEFGLTKLAIHYLGFQFVIYCRRSLTDPIFICHISLRLQLVNHASLKLVNHTSLQLHVITNIEIILNASIYYSKICLWYCHLITFRHAVYVIYSGWFGFQSCTIKFHLEAGTRCFHTSTCHTQGLQSCTSQLVICNIGCYYIYDYNFFYFSV